MALDPTGCWAILRLTNGDAFAGLVSEEAVFGMPAIRIDMPGGEETVSQFYAHSAIYSVTPTTEAVVNKVAASFEPRPIHRYQLLRFDKESEE